MRVVYIAHPLGKDPGERAANIERAKKWVAWAADQGVAPVADWITLASQWDESKREKGLAIDVELVKRCDELWLCGPRISAGMRVEADAALAAGKRIVDLTSRDTSPPTHVISDAEVDAFGPALPVDSEARKQVPVFSGVLNYFPLAIAAVARLSKRGNDKHNPGEPLHWARDKSTDHADCIARHLIDHVVIDSATGEHEEAAAIAWRALALLQELEEKRLGKPRSRGSR